VKYILLGLSLYASEAMLKWPGKGELARMSGFDEDRVEKALKAAKDAGYLRSVRRFNETVYYMVTPQQSRAMYGAPENDEIKVRVSLTVEEAKKVREIIDPDGMIGDVLAVFKADGA